MLTALLLLTAGCADRMPVWSEFTAFPSQEWTPDMTVEAEPWPLDSVIAAPADAYRLTLCLRYRLPAPEWATVVVEQESPDTPMQADTLRIRLADKAGAPAGKGAYGLYTVECPVPAHPALKPGYTVAMRPLATLPSITEAGLLLLPPPQKSP